MSNKIKFLIFLPFLALICSVLVISGYALYNQKFEIEGSFKYNPVETDPVLDKNWCYNGMVFEADTEAGKNCLSVRAKDVSALPEILEIPEKLIKKDDEVETIYTVTSIGTRDITYEGAFMRANLSKVIIPSTVTSIGFVAFAGCVNLKTIDLPENLTTIGGRAFAASGLNQINLPPNLKSLKIGAFSSCKSLTSINIPEGINVIEPDTFSSSGLISIDIPKSVKQIQNSAFSYCTNLRTINFSEGLEEILDQAFEECPNLTSVKLPQSLSTIGMDAFARSGITSINIPSKITLAPGFVECMNLETVIIENISMSNNLTNYFDSCLYSLRIGGVVYVKEKATGGELINSDKWTEEEITEEQDLYDDLYHIEKGYYKYTKKA